MTASCKIKLLRVLISALFIVFACNVRGNDQYEDKLISSIKDTNLKIHDRLIRYQRHALSRMAADFPV